MLKHGEPGWRIEFKPSCSAKQWAEASDPMWFWGDYNYRAVRIEKTIVRTPLPIEHYKRGMEVKISDICGTSITVGTKSETGWIVVIFRYDSPISYYAPSRIEKWRWPNESEWHPAFTETTEEREVERLEVEG